MIKLSNTNTIKAKDDIYIIKSRRKKYENKNRTNKTTLLLFI